MDIGVLLDGSVGALVGALITGAAQIWSFRKGLKSARSDLNLDAARQLLEVVHSSNKVLRLLPYTDSAAGSPLSYSERLSNAGPMRDELRHAEFAIVPLLTDREVARRFGQYQRYCDHVSGPHVDAQDIHRAVELVISYGDHVRECLIAHIDKKPLPAEPHPQIPALD